MLKSRIIVVLAALAATAALAGCGDNEESTAQPGTVRTASNGDVFNEADVRFATEMIPHHAGALVMVDMTRGRQLSPEVRELTEQIQAAQSPEIETMTDWLSAWGEPIPETMRDHVNGGHDDGGGGHDMGGMEMDSSMPGMMSGEEMEALEHAQGAEFEQMWLEMMIEHHQGAIEMAEKEQESGRFKPALNLATSIAESQQKEIRTMERLLDS